MRGCCCCRYVTYTVCHSNCVKEKEKKTEKKQNEQTWTLLHSNLYYIPPTHAQTLIMIIYWLCILHASHEVEEKRGALRGFATVGPPAEMRGEVRAKERGVWRRLTNRLYAGNGTNHGYSSGLCCSLFLGNSPFFLTSPSYLLLSS